jgi:hypothetical protein
MDQAPASDRLVKLLLIADGKAGKTFYAGSPAGEGFNVLYLDGDVGSQTLTQLPIEFQRHIYLLAMHDTINSGMRDTNFYRSLWGFMSNHKFKWNDTLGRMATRGDTEGEIWEVVPSMLDHNCVLVIDSWTSFVESLMLQAARDHSVDLTTATQPQMRPVYGASGVKATAALQVIKSIPCHVIVIAHPDEYQHKVAPEGRRVSDVKEQDLEIAWTKLIPKSTSKPHGLILPKYFTDVAWLTISPSGRRQLDFKPKADRVGGGHFDSVKPTDEYSFSNLIKQLGGSVPGKGNNAPVDSWLTITQASDQASPDAKVLDGNDATPIKGFAGLGIKKG